MTTIVSLAARDFIVVGCDSLATTSLDLVFPHELSADFFEANGNLKLDANGKPLLRNSSEIWSRAKSMPVDQLPSVVKLYDLEPMKACLLFAGASRIGDTTIRNLVETFKAKKEIRSRKSTYTIEWVGNQFRDFVIATYEREIPEAWMRPTMEVILSGYSASHREPEIWRLVFSFDRSSRIFECTVTNDVPRKSYNVLFGGQYDVIQRVVNGIDGPSYWSLRQRTFKALDQYHDEMQAAVHAINPNLTIPKPDFWQQKYNIFGNDQGGVTRIFSDVGSLSEQAGIDFVYFLIDMMIKSQEFASSIPTVGGKIHVAMLTKSAKLKWISKESFRFENEHVLKF